MRPSARLGLTIEGRQEAFKVVEGMRALLADEGRWCRATLATDAGGSKVSVWDPNASCFCIVGALRKTFLSIVDKDERKYHCDDLAVHALFAKLQQLYPWHPYATSVAEKIMYLEEFNDGQADFRDVVNLLDRTLEELRE